MKKNLLTELSNDDVTAKDQWNQKSSNERKRDLKHEMKSFMTIYFRDNEKMSKRNPLGPLQIMVFLSSTCCHKGSQNQPTHTFKYKELQAFALVD